MNTLQQFISFASEIFSLTGFQKEQVEKNVNGTVLLLLQSSTVAELEKYSKEERTVIMHRLQSTTDEKELEKILQSVFAGGPYEKLLQQNSRKILFGISKKIMNDLGPEELGKLENILLTVSKTFSSHTD